MATPLHPAPGQTFTLNGGTRERIATIVEVSPTYDRRHRIVTYHVHGEGFAAYIHGVDHF